MQMMFSFLAAAVLSASSPAAGTGPLHRADSVRISVAWPELIADDAMPDRNGYTVALVGDIMMGTTFPTERLPEHDGATLFESVGNLLREADIAAGNLEGVLCDGGESTKKVVEGRSYAFRMPERYVEWLADAGFDFLSIANNHSRDFGMYGIDRTESLLDSVSIGYAGLPDCRFSVRNIDGADFGFCAFGHNSHTLKHTDKSCVENVIKSVRDSCDILIVSFHGGAEGAAMSHLPYGEETYLGENRGNLRELARLCIDLGADIVFGHGPHVTRAVELYRDRFIAYSLGNFCTPYGINISGINGYAPVLCLRIARDGSFRSGKIHSFIQVPGSGPRPDLSCIVARHIAALTSDDIPDSSLTVDGEGNIRR